MTDQRFMLLLFDITVGASLLIFWLRDLYDWLRLRRYVKRQLAALPIVYPKEWLLDVYVRGRS